MLGKRSSARSRLAAPKRVILWLLTFGLLAGVAVVPAAATHIQEPTTPITAVTLRLWQYNAPSTITPCSSDGPLASLPVVTFDNLRVDAFVTTTATPSEHFVASMAIFKVTLENGPRLVAGSKWVHQNVPPHAANATTTGWYGFWMDLPNLSQHQGKWWVHVVVKGQESGQQFNVDCLFRKT